MRAIRIHDTLTGGPVELTAERGRTGIYACGPTVYARIHVGNARPFIVFSLLKRFLEHEGLEVDLVINITDVNDKIYDAARAAGVPSAQLAEQMTEHYIADTSALGLGRPDHEPRAVDTIAEIVELIEALIARGAAYPSGGDVYFRVHTDEHYGELSNRSVDEMSQGEMPDDAGRKEDGLDFALWKAHKDGEDTSWPSPWGPGRPGWHIECSAMAEKLLGLDFAIHGGGSDLVFPHHENEAAQTRMGRDGQRLARIWMHNGMLQLGDEKMAKSIGNIAPLHDVIARHGAATVVMLMIGAHYRQPLAFSDETLADAAARVRRVREAARRVVDGPSPEWSGAIRERFFAALADDFSTPRAMAALFEWIREANASEAPAGGADLAEMLGVLGLDSLLAADAAAPPEVVALAGERERARAARDFARADELRDAIAAAGWTVRDAPGGFELVRA